MFILVLLGGSFAFGALSGIAVALAMAKMDPISFARLQLHFAVLMWRLRKRLGR